MDLDWQTAWELYCDTHIDPDWYEFEKEYYGDEEVSPEDDYLDDDGR